MDDIAAEAGLTKPILYSYFGAKAGLASALAERHLNELLPTVLASFSGDGNVKDMVRKAIDTFIGFVDQDPAVYRFLVRGVPAEERSFSEQRIVNEFGRGLGQVLRSALRAANIDPRPAELWSFSILGFVLAGAEWWQARPKMTRAELTDYLTEFVWGGLTAGGVRGADAATVFGGSPAAAEQAATNDKA
jgi:AcrR family transcriptional regulator